MTDPSLIDVMTAIRDLKTIVEVGVIAIILSVGVVGCILSWPEQEKSDD